MGDPHRAALRGLLTAVFGYPDFRPGQYRAIRAALAGRDVFVNLRTGAGKSLVFQYVAAFARSYSSTAVTVVISPLVALMQDQCANLNRKVGLGADGRPARASARTTAFACYLGADQRVTRDIVGGRFAVVYLSPEMFECVGRALGGIGAVACVAVDEAHCVHDHARFRDSYTTLGSVRDVFGTTPVVALTATATTDVTTDVLRTLRMSGVQHVVGDMDRPNLMYVVERFTTSVGVDRVIGRLGRLAAGDRAIVYAPTRKHVERVVGALAAHRLLPRGVAVGGYHAGMSPAAKRATLHGFVQSPATFVVVATGSFGMGVDRADVRLVVHHGLPRSMSAYVQGSGRAGRDGRPSMCVLMFSDEDPRHIYPLQKARPSKDALKAYDVMYKFACDVATCRRARVLRHFPSPTTADAAVAVPPRRCCDVCATTCVDRDSDDLRLLAWAVLSGGDAPARRCIDDLVGRRTPGHATPRALCSAGRHLAADAWWVVHDELVGMNVLEASMRRVGRGRYPVVPCARVRRAPYEELVRGWVPPETPRQRAHQRLAGFRFKGTQVKK